MQAAGIMKLNALERGERERVFGNDIDGRLADARLGDGPIRFYFVPPKGAGLAFVGPMRIRAVAFGGLGLSKGFGLAAVMAVGIIGVAVIRMIKPRGGGALGGGDNNVRCFKGNR